MLRYHYFHIFKRVALISFLSAIFLSANSSYIGCFKDSGNPFGLENRDLDGFYVNKSDMSIKECISLCRSKKFKYAGVENSSQCFCGNSYGKYGEAENCNMKCSGNPNEICGGFWAISLYSTKEQVDNSHFLDNLNKQDNKDDFNNDKNLPQNNKDSLSELSVTSIELSDTIVENSNDSRVILGKVANKFPLNVSKIDALIHVEGAKNSDSITAKWISKDAFPKTNMTLAEAEVTLEPSKKDIHLYYDNSTIPLRVGHYALEIFSGNKLLAIKEFSIVESNTTTNSYNIPDGIDSYKLKIYLSKKIKKDSDGTIEPVEVTDNFANSQHEIYATIPFENLKLKTPFSIEWVVIFDGVNFNKVIYKQEGTIKAKKGVLKALLTNSQRWPDGVFEVFLRLNGDIVAKKKFTIGNSENLKKLKLQNIDIKLDENLKKQLLNSLKEWMLEAISKKDLKPLYEHSIHTVRDSFNWDELKKGLEPVFNTALDWSAIFAQSPKSFIAKKGKGGAVTIDAVYGGIEGIDILLEGTFYKEDGEWRLLGFAFEPLKQEKEGYNEK